MMMEKASLEQVLAVVESMTSAQRREFVAKMRSFVDIHPDDAQAVLRENPTLSWAFVQMLTLEDLIPNLDVDAFVAKEAAPRPPQPQAGQPGAPGQMAVPMAGAPPPPHTQGMHPPPGGAPPPGPPPQGQPGAFSTAGLLHMLSNINPQLILATLGEENTAILTEVLSMTPQQFAALSPDQRAAINAIEQQLSSLFAK